MQIHELKSADVWDFAKYVRRNKILAGSDLKKNWDEIGWMHGLNIKQLVDKHGGYISVDPKDFTHLDNLAQQEKYFDLDTYCKGDLFHKKSLIGQKTMQWQVICDGIPKDACEAAYYSISDEWCKFRRIHTPEPLAGYHYAEPKIITNPLPPPFRFEKTYKCKYCGTVTDCTVDEDVLCKDCREVFGHTYYSEL